jgi:hypothetical protein
MWYYRTQACGLAGRGRGRCQGEATTAVLRLPSWPWLVAVDRRAVDLEMSVSYRVAAGGSRVFVADLAREFTDCRASNTRSLMSPVELLELHWRVI